MTTAKQRQQLLEVIELIRSVVDDHPTSRVRVVTGSVRVTVRAALVLMYRSGRDEGAGESEELINDVREAWQALGFPGEPWEK